MPRVKHLFSAKSSVASVRGGSNGHQVQIIEPLNGDWDSNTVDPATDVIIATETERARPA